MQEYTLKEDYELPSKGLIYNKEVNPHISLRSMTTRDEMKRCSQTETPYKLLAEIIEGCMIEKPAVPVYDMALGDYEYLLHKLRIVTHGSKYKMTVGCPHCEQIYDAVIDLDTLEVNEFDRDKFEEARSFRLKKSDKIITINFQTPRMLDTIELKVKEFKKRNKGITIDPSAMITLEELIDTVDGKKLTFTELETFINNLPAADYNYIMYKSAELNKLIGLNTQIDVVCDKCGGDITTYFRFGPEFFRPSVIED